MAYFQGVACALSETHEPTRNLENAHPTLVTFPPGSFQRSQGALEPAAQFTAVSSLGRTEEGWRTALEGNSSHLSHPQKNLK